MKRLYSNIIDLTGFDCDEDEEEESVQPPIPFKLSVRPDPELKFPPGNSHRLGRSSAAISRTPSDGSYKLSDWWGSATSIIPALAASAARMVTSPKAALASVVSSVTANGALSPKESSQPASSSLRTDSFSMSTSPSPSPSCPFPALTPQGTRVIKKPCVDLSMSDEDSPLPSLKARASGIEKQVLLKSPVPKYEFAQRWSKTSNNSPPRNGNAIARISKDAASSGGSNSSLKENQSRIIKVEKSSDVLNSVAPVDDIDKLLATFDDLDAGTPVNKTVSDSYRTARRESKVLLEDATDQQLKFIEIQVKRRLQVGEIDALAAEMEQLRDRFAFRRLPGVKLIIRYLLNDNEAPNKRHVIVTLRTMLSFDGNWSAPKELWVDLVKLERQLCSDVKGREYRALMDGLALTILNECISKLVQRSDSFGYISELRLLRENATQGLAETSLVAKRMSTSISGGHDLLLALAYLEQLALANKMMSEKSKVDKEELVECSSWGNLIREFTRPGGPAIQTRKNFNS